MRAVTALMRAVTALILLLPCLAAGQKLIDGRQHRHDWCPIAKQFDYSTDTVKLGLALAGLNVTIGFVNYPPTSELDEDGKTASGYDWDVMQRVAAKGGFNLTTVKLQYPEEEEDWDDILQRVAPQADIMATWWADTAKRRHMGLQFSKHTVDTTLVMMIKKEVELESYTDLFFRFAQPFQPRLWLTFLAVVFGSVAILTWMGAEPEAGTKDGALLPADKRSPGESWAHRLQHVFLMTFTGMNLLTIRATFTPKTWPSRIVVASLHFVVMIVMVLYAAQLTTFLVVETKDVGLRSLQDLKDLRPRVSPCQVKGVGYGNKTFDFFKINPEYPPPRTIDKVNETTIHLLDGTCKAALVARNEAEQLINKHTDCDSVIEMLPLSLDGAEEEKGGGGMVSSVEGCGAFLMAVVSNILQDMEENLELQGMWDTYTKQYNECDNQDEMKSSVGMDIKNVWGVFVIHGAFTTVAIGFAFFTKWRRHREKSRASHRNLEPAAGDLDDQKCLCSDCLRTFFPRTDSRFRTARQGFFWGGVSTEYVEKSVTKGEQLDAMYKAILDLNKYLPVLVKVAGLEATDEDEDPTDSETSTPTHLQGASSGMAGRRSKTLPFKHPPPMSMFRHDSVNSNRSSNLAPSKRSSFNNSEFGEADPEDCLEV